jgi:hypothetical protein
MTKLNIYCVFDKTQALYGVYSSIKAAHRDALKLCNSGYSPVVVFHNSERKTPNATLLRNIFKGEIDVKVDYFSDNSKITILKTSLRE